jgi:hypothetical protein
VSDYDNTFTTEASKRLNKAMAERLGIKHEEMLGGFEVEHTGSDRHVTVTAQIVQKWDLDEFAEWWNALRLEVKP